MKQWFVYIEDRDYASRRDIYICQEDEQSGERTFVAPTTLTEVMPVSAEPPAAFTDVGRRRSDGLLQAILDAAWAYGLRPKDFEDHKNEIAAVRYHLEDMRALAKVPARPARP